MKTQNPANCVFSISLYASSFLFHSEHPDFPQSWILPLLKDYIQQAELAYYVQDLLPMAGQMRLLAQDWREKGRALEAKLYDTLEIQV